MDGGGPVGEGPNWTGLTPGGWERGGGGLDGGLPLVAMMMGWFSYTSSSSSSGAPFTKKPSELCKPLWIKRSPLEPKCSTVGDVVKALKRGFADMRPEKNKQTGPGKGRRL